MLEGNTTREKVIAATLRLAAAKGWKALGLDEIANEAGVNLRELRNEFCAKSQILAAFTRAVDDAVLEQIKPAAAGDTQHDRLFDVIMTRFETLNPYKEGVKRIIKDLPFEPGAAAFQILPALGSQYWMLSAAGVNAGALSGAWRVPGAAAAYASAFKVWLEDEDPGLAKTMAALDKRLRRGEGLARRCEDVCEAGRLLFRALLPGGYNDASRRKDDSPAAGEPGASAPAATA
jgi:ubiquinone biosynthesis protein COQ9